MIQGTAKIQCSCHHEFQDQKYGRGVRVANSTAKQDKDRVEVRCTVCSKTHSVPAAQVK